VTFKYSYAFSNLFGTDDSKGSTYADLSANFDLGKGYTLTPHIGVQDIKGQYSAGYSYVDYALTVGKDFGAGYSGTVSLVSVNAMNMAVYARNNIKDQVILGVKYSF
jgi:uncharacterized protein (TIGR02001 family)